MSSKTIPVEPELRIRDRHFQSSNRYPAHSYRPAIAIGLLLVIFVGAPAIASSKAAARNAAARMAGEVSIYRDIYGVPHIYGPTDASCSFGYGYAQAEDNFTQLEDNYIHALGRAAEAYGDQELASDILNRALEIPKFSLAEYQTSGPRLKQICDGFALGVNYFLEHNPQVHPVLLTHFEPWYIFAFSRYALYQLFIFQKSGLKSDQILTTLKDRDAAAQTGSNMWAVSPSKSADGHALLFINPHQPFFGPGQWYEGHLHSDQGWDISGASFFGSPFPTLGHNQYLGWSHTVNEPDILDLYLERFDNAKDPLAYKYAGSYREAVSWNEAIKVKTAAGIETREIPIIKTHHGPVVAIKNASKITIRMARLQEGGQVQECYEMTRARSLAEFKAAMSHLAIPMFNAAYADRDGNIFYVYNAAVPRRSTKYDWSKPVDGSDPGTEWQGYHTFDELPQVTNPLSGFVQNCNSTPFLTTTEGNPDKSRFSAYMVGEGDTPRAQISRRILSQSAKFTFDDWAADAFDTRILEAETYIPELVKKWEALKAAHPNRANHLAPVIDSLKAWDHIATLDSQPMTIFALWFEAMMRARTSPATSAKPDPNSEIKSLEDVVAHLEATFGTWKVAWGDINRLERRGTLGKDAFSDASPSLPVAGAPGWLGVVFNFYTRPEKGQKRRYGVVGSSFMSIVDFGPKVKAESILVFGENADPASRHYFDQAHLYADERFKPAWFDLNDIKEHLERAYHPGAEQPGAAAR